VSEQQRWRHYGNSTEERGWRSGWHALAGPNTKSRIEWHLLGEGFGIGVQLGRNGTESDLGLDLHVSRLGSVWLRHRSPWTRWLRITDHDRDHWYEARHYGIRLRPHRGCWVRIQFGAYEGMGPKGRRWREVSFSPRSVFGLNDYEQVEGWSGMTNIPMPEGNYPSQWTEVTTTTRYTRPLGRLRDRVIGPRTSRYIKLDIPGGIPVEGKGENSWDCGMDGILGSSGPTIEDAVANCVRSALRRREQYGGPHNLPRPMSIAEAEQREDTP
jgi:hypothetical protein